MTEFVLKKYLKPIILLFIISGIGSNCFLNAEISIIKRKAPVGAKPVTISEFITITWGDDWSMPAWVKPKKYSGLFGMSKELKYNFVHNVGATIYWSDLNPADGEYNWSSITKKMKIAGKKKGMVVFRLKSSVTKRRYRQNIEEQGPFMPQWVLDKHKPKTFYTRKGYKGSLLYAAPWNTGVQEEYRKFVMAFAKKKFVEDKRFAAIYVSGISSSYGEEFNLKKQFMKYALEAGMTAKKIETTFENRLTWWYEAIGKEYSSKICWVGAKSFPGMKIDHKRLNKLAMKNGFGIRGGFIEHYFYSRVLPPKIGQSYKNGYIINDWFHPLRDGRYFGDENEEIDEFPGVMYPEIVKHCFRSPFFRSAQVGINFLWVSSKVIRKAPDIAKWYTFVAGKTPEESPEATCWLREAYVRMPLKVRNRKKSYPHKNFERLLMQRDIPGAKTLNVIRYDLPYSNMKDRKRTYEYSARSTDVENGQNKIVFKLNNRFRKSIKGKTCIKIMFLDNSKAKWQLAVSHTGKKMVEYGFIQGQNDGYWKTASFTLDKGFEAGAVSTNMDFEIQVLNDENVTVRFVRLIKMET